MHASVLMDFCLCHCVMSPKECNLHWPLFLFLVLSLGLCHAVHETALPTQVCVYGVVDGPA